MIKEILCSFLPFKQKQIQGCQAINVPTPSLQKKINRNFSECSLVAIQLEHSFFLFFPYYRLYSIHFSVLFFRKTTEGRSLSKNPNF